MNGDLMTRDEFLAGMDELLGLSAGTLHGNERLEELENWDSTSLISLIAMIDTNSGVRISPRQIVGCSTIADLLRLAKVEPS
jgi:acyl carrier protein